MSAQPAPVLDPPRTRQPRSETGPRLAVAPPPPVPVPRAPFIGLVLLVVVGGVLGVLLLNTEIDENAFHLEELRREQAALDQRQQELEEQIAAASSTAQLAAAARQLGLVRAGDVGRLRMPDGEIQGDPAPIAPDPDRPTGAGAPEPGSEEE
jgi:hypothetical protein